MHARDANCNARSIGVRYCTEVNTKKEKCICLNTSVGHWHVPVKQPVSLLRGETKKCAGPSQLGVVYSRKYQERGKMSEGRDLQDFYNYRNNNNLQHVTFLCSIRRFLFP
jgi:hypothetical protein